jgi:hypothetical protein
MGAGISAFQGVPFVLGQSAPDSCVLAGVDGPTQAGLHDLTATADNSCLFDLVKRWVGVSYREEQLRVLVQAGSTVAPSHQNRPPRIGECAKVSIT